jgi:predicted GNAT family acetyltransferase
MNYTDLKLMLNTSAHRFELEAEGSTAFIDYKLSHQKLFLIHTEVPHALEGKGIGSAIVQKTLQYAKDNGYTIVPICKFVQSYLQRDTEWNDIIDPDAGRFMNKH